MIEKTKIQQLKILKLINCLHLLYLHFTQPKFLDILSVEARKQVLFSGSLKLEKNSAQQRTITTTIFGGTPSPVAFNFVCLCNGRLIQLRSTEYLAVQPYL